MIAHVDADAFFASVLVRKDPRLRGKPLFALGMGGGCVIAASYEAKAKGVKTGMRFVDAAKLCPDSEAVLSDFEEACIASRQIEEILASLCPLIERASVDEWYLDVDTMVGGVPDDLASWAQALQSTINQGVGLTVSIGIASSKLLAKMAAEYRKPAGLTILEQRPSPYPLPPHFAKATRGRRGEGSRVARLSREAFLKDRPAEAIPGIGNRRAIHARLQQWKTAWDITIAPADTLKELFGRPGIDLQRELQGECLSPVAEDMRPPKSISRCRSFKALKDERLIFAHIVDHLSRTVLKMRLQGLACRRIAVWLRDAEYRHSGDDCRLPQPLDNEEQILPYVKSAFRSLRGGLPSVTQAGIALLELCPRAQMQYSLFENPKNLSDAEEVQNSLDAIRERYGRDVIVRGASIITPRQASKPFFDALGAIGEAK